MEMNIEDFTGLTVQHCHVLSHEDLGMMEAIEIIE
jgi:FtsP/CotA-like multicopper oxidase with cupredoxin domain